MAEPEGTAAGDAGEEQEAPRRDDGLDLARAMARATAGTTPAARRTPRSRTGRRPRGDAVTGGGYGASGDDRDPQLVGSSLSRLVTQHGWELELRVRSVFARWSELVGTEVGEHSTPESLTEGRLVVRAHSTAWATQLRLLSPRIAARLEEELGRGTVTGVEVLGPQAPRWTRGRLSTRDSRGPRDTYG